MPRIVLVESPEPVLWMRYSGLVTLAQRQRALEEAVERALAAHCFRALVDFRSALSLQHDDIVSRDIAKFLVDHIGDHDVRIAWLMRYDHQLDDLVEKSVAKLGIATGRFHDRDEALAWLQAPAPMPVPVPAPSRPKRARRRAAPAKHDAIEIVARIVGADARMSAAQYGAAVRLVEELLATGMDEARIEPIARPVLEAMNSGHARGSGG